jgi:RNA polymerase sigma-70 factor (ECF subfamily)
MQSGVPGVGELPIRDSDADLGRRLATGDESALAQLYDRYAGVVHGVALRVTRDRGGAEDVTQEVFTYAWGHADRFDAARGSWQGWLATVAYRRAVDWVRSEAARRRRAIQSLPEPTASAEDAAIDADVVRQVRRAVDALPQAHRDCVRMAYYEGRSVKELAAVLGVPEGTAKTRLRAARLRLADYLGAEGLVGLR